MYFAPIGLSAVEFHFEQIVPAAVEDVFTFHQDPGNLTHLLAQWGRFRLLSHDGPVQQGCVMWVQEAFFALPVALGFRCTVCERPARLGGELFHGPFERFTHMHEFDACAGGTRVCDRLTVVVPWQFGGERAMRRLIAPLLRRAFRCRQKALLDLARAGRLREVNAC